MTPNWLTDKFIEDVLINADKDHSISIAKIHVTNATKKGDNYSSDVYRVNFEFTCPPVGKKTRESRTLIVKTIQDDGERFMDGIKIYENEINMLTKTLPAMESVIKDTKFAPRCLYSQLKNPLLLVMEDLEPLGFEMANRQTGLDFQHCMLAIKRLAMFHASSVLVCEKEPAYKENHKIGILTGDYPLAASEFFTYGLKSMAKTAESWSELSEECKRKLFRLTDSAYEKARELGKLREDEFNVINHGDCWINNMLFKYDGRGNVIDQIFVDFQISCYGTPALDLLTFFYTSLPEELMLHHQDALIAEYAKALSLTMEKIGCKTPCPSFDCIKETLAEKLLIGFVIACSCLPLALLDQNQAQNLNEMFCEDYFISKAYCNRELKKRMLPKILEWDALGLFDNF